MATVVIGATFMDIKGFSSVPYMPTGTNIGTVQMSHGGVSRNVCEDFARQGMPTAFVSMTDHSAGGREIRDHLSALGVDLTHTLFAENGMGLWLAILDQGGELVGSVSQQPNFAVLEDYIREHGEAIIAGADSIVLEIDMNAAIAKMVLDMAERHGKPVYCIVGNMGVILQHPEYLRQVSCFICNEIEAGRLFEADLTRLTPDEMLALLPEQALAHGVGAMVVTMGPDGAVFFDSSTGDKGHCPAIPATMVDSTGAGDAFFAGTIMALSRRFTLRRAVCVGARLAACTIACDRSSCDCISDLFEIDE